MYLRSSTALGLVDRTDFLVGFAVFDAPNMLYPVVALEYMCSPTQRSGLLIHVFGSPTTILPRSQSIVNAM